MSLYQLLETHQVSYQKFEHVAVFNCEQANELDLDTDALATKNLFLRDRKGRNHFLLVLRDDSPVDLKSLSVQLDVKGLSFASKERLQQHLQTEPGSVSILDILKDSASEVNLLVEQAVWDSAAIQAHPWTNTATLAIETADLQRLLVSLKRPVQCLELA